MKLYSRRRIVLTAVASAAVASVLVASLFLLYPEAAGKLLSIRPGPAGSGVRVSATPAQDAASTVRPASSAGGEATAYAIPAVDAEDRENIDVYERFNEAVVNITTEVIGVNWFLEPVPQQGGSGSGSIIDQRGYVLTNHHVVKNAVRLYVYLSDGSRHEAKLVGSDPENDLAVVKFDPPRDRAVTTIPFGDSSLLRVGQKVLAIGNPFGLERTMTQGIVSGIGRPVRADSDTIIQNMIQTDASINPGNSGGPLLDARGAMIGINAMIYSTSGGSVGIGFAVPVNTAKRIVPELIARGRVIRGWIDIQGIQLFPDLVDYMRQNGMDIPVDKGLLVSRATRGSNAERAGIRGGTTAVRYGSAVFNIGGDVIVSVDGTPVTSIADLHAALEDNKPGETVPVEYIRGRERLAANVVLVERDASGGQTR